jgi:GAF domain-containing protein
LRFGRSVRSVIISDMQADDARAAVADSQLESPAPVVRWGRPEQGADLRDALGGQIDSDEQLARALRTLVGLAHKTIDGAASCGISVSVSGRSFTAAHSDARTLIVDTEQYEAGDGPCLHSARTGTVVRVDAIDAEKRWPQFAASARSENIRSFLAAPLHTPDTRFGSLNLYGEAPSAFTDSDVDIALALTDALSHAVGHYQRFDRLLDQYNGLRLALEHRAPIEQAKGMLMAIHRIDADAAFDMLATRSQHENRKLRDIAADVITDIVGRPTAGE